MSATEPISTERDHLKRKPLRLLVVEDSALDVELVERQLTRAQYDVTAMRVESAAAFTEALRGRDWDVIIADSKVPGFGAVAALDILRQSRRDIPFIIVSGAITDGIAVASMRAGAHDYVARPAGGGAVDLGRPRPALSRPA